MKKTKRKQKTKKHNQTKHDAFTWIIQIDLKLYIEPHTHTHTHTRTKPIELNLLKLAIIFVGFLASCKGATTWQKPKNVKVSAENCKEYLQINASY